MLAWPMIRRGNGHPTWGAVWIELGRLRLIWCAPKHPSRWLIVWARKRTPAAPTLKLHPGETTAADNDADDLHEIAARLDLHEVAARFDLHEVAARLPVLTKIARDLEYRLPESGKPLKNIALAREQCIELLALCAGNGDRDIENLKPKRKSEGKT